MTPTAVPADECRACSCPPDEHRVLVAEATPGHRSKATICRRCGHVWRTTLQLVPPPVPSGHMAAVINLNAFHNKETRPS